MFAFIWTLQVEYDRFNMLLALCCRRLFCRKSCRFSVMKFIDENIIVQGTLVMLLWPLDIIMKSILFLMSDKFWKMKNADISGTLLRISNEEVSSVWLMLIWGWKLSYQWCVTVRGFFLLRKQQPVIIYWWNLRIKGLWLVRRILHIGAKVNLEEVMWRCIAGRLLAKEVSGGTGYHKFIMKSLPAGLFLVCKGEQMEGDTMIICSGCLLRAG